MFNILIKFAAIIIVCSSLTIFWHATAMSEGMDMGHEMPVLCLSTCLSNGSIAVETAPAEILVPVAALFLLLINIFLCPSSFKRDTIRDLFKKDRHRYLMKTAVMLR